MERSGHILSEDQLAAGALRIRGRSSQLLEDLALYYILFATGARPLEIARLEVRDYLDANGCVRVASEFRSEIAINGRPRPLFFRSRRLDDALYAYLSERVADRFTLGADDNYRGLHPTSRLFLSSSGQGFEITRHEANGQKQFQCRGILETYRKIFRYAGFENMTALRARRTVVAKLYARGADEAQVGLLLGIAEPSAVRAQFPRDNPTLEALVVNLI
ncbi:phage integrase family protein [Acidovorax delafieldii 2AN]|uniref:Phage integrase family protein n=1 Tax=Acidovorax delafieldii 2AN TaxID=573060 RepID=C5T7Y8_ACIDE|nr:site-specific integrase [Acidovorax delafieldii]EER59404.1 phage integrase family protein [Acidovorax delafieldii 2AN]